MKTITASVVLDGGALVVAGKGDAGFCYSVFVPSSTGPGLEEIASGRGYVSTADAVEHGCRYWNEQGSW